MRQRLAYLVDHGLAERSGTQVTLKGNLLATLHSHEIGALARSVAAETGLTYRDTHDGESIRGVYRRPLDLASGRFAMLDDGVGFSLVPWRPVRTSISAKNYGALPWAGTSTGIFLGLEG